MSPAQLDQIIQECPADPRRGLPSASAMDRLQNCPGSWWACKGLPDVETDDAASGTRIHKALEGANSSSVSLVALSPDEQETAEMCAAQRSDVEADWLARFETDPPTDMERREHRLGLTVIGGVVDVTEKTEVPLLLTGQADVIVCVGAHGLAIDYKTGRGDYKHAKSNAQLRTLAVLAAKRWRLESVRVAIVQPWRGKPTVADYNAEALRESTEWLLSVLESIKHAQPQDLQAGEWCKWCRAKDSCPALRSRALAPVESMTRLLPADGSTARAALFARAMELAPADLAGYYRGLKLVGWFTAAIEGAMRKRVEAGEMPGYRMKPGVDVREITDAQAAFELAHRHGVSSEVFMGCVKVTLGDFEDALRRSSGPKITASGKPHRTQFALSADDAKTLANKLMDVGAMKKRTNADQIEEVSHE